VAVTIEPVSAVMPPLELAPSGRDGGWHVLSFTMPANGADDDGYVGVRFVISS
jgi:hypothetical protein